MIKEGLREIKLGGKPYKIGFNHGRLLKSDIQRMIKGRIGRLPVKRNELRLFARKFLGFHIRYSPFLFEELKGISEGAEVNLEELLITNGFTDFKDAVSFNLNKNDGCTAFVVHGNATSDKGIYLGQNWDTNPPAENCSILLKLKPDGCPCITMLSFAGCIGIIGMNEEGIGIAVNNLVPTDARPGVLWPFMVREALSKRTIEEAISSLTKAEPASGHNFLIADRKGKIYNYEYTATRYKIIVPTKRCYVHTNHYQSKTLKRLEDKNAVNEENSSTFKRYKRMNYLLKNNMGKITLPLLQKFLGDHKDSPYSICVHSWPEDVETCGSIIMRLDRGEIYTAKGNPCKGIFKRWKF